MHSSTDNHQDELAQLKAICEQRRALGKRTKYPADFQQRVVALRKAGFSALRLQEELGVSSSQVFKWMADEKSGAPPKVVNIRPQQPETASPVATMHQPLQLQIGGYRITIEMTEVA